MDQITDSRELPMSADELESRLRQIGRERYHSLHPFHRLLHGGRLNFGQVQAWALNRSVYQAGIPRKDAALMARMTDREQRREWIRCIHDHDGDGQEPAASSAGSGSPMGCSSTAPV